MSSLSGLERLACVSRIGKRFTLWTYFLFATAFLGGCGGREDASNTNGSYGSSQVASVAGSLPMQTSSAQPQIDAPSKQVNAQSAQNTPQNGWWWNPTEGGRGFAIERQGDQLFMAAFLYETNGVPPVPE